MPSYSPFSSTCSCLPGFLSVVFRVYQYLSQELYFVFSDVWVCCFSSIAITDCILQDSLVFICSACNSHPDFLNSFFFFFLFNNSLQSTRVPFCLLSQNNQHFDFFSIFMFPWWREYYNLFLWLTSFEWYTLQIYFLIFWHSFPLWTLCIQEKHI